MAASYSWQIPQRMQPAIVEVSRGQTTVLRPSSEAEVPTALVSPVEMLSWKTSDGEEAHGFYYAPVNPDFAAPEGELPR